LTPEGIAAARSFEPIGVSGFVVLLHLRRREVLITDRICRRRLREQISPISDFDSKRDLSKQPPWH